MLERLPIKKEYLLVAATIVLLIVSYRFAIKATIEAWQTHHQLTLKLNQSGDLSYQPQYLERKTNNLDKTIDLYKADTVELRNNIINTISSIAEKENVKLTEVPAQDVAYRSDRFIIEKLSFEGSYFSLVKLANELQHTNKVGMIRSEILRSIEIRSSAEKTKKIVLDLYFEIVK